MDPVLGWRIWHLRNGRLESWAVDYCWEPGENLARCLAPHRRACEKAPGLHCQCGFWAVWHPGQCLSRACAAAEPPWFVMGLVLGYGTVALHGREGFRSERVILRCLFTDRPWATDSDENTDRRMVNWWRRTINRVEDRPTLEGYLFQLEGTAAHYGVPLLSLANAAEMGVLKEFGVSESDIDEAIRMGEQ